MSREINLTQDKDGRADKHICIQPAFDYLGSDRSIRAWCPPLSKASRGDASATHFYITCDSGSWPEQHTSNPASKAFDRPGNICARQRRQGGTAALRVFPFGIWPPPPIHVPTPPTRAPTAEAAAAAAAGPKPSSSSSPKAAASGPTVRSVRQFSISSRSHRRSVSPRNQSSIPNPPADDAHT